MLLNETFICCKRITLYFKTYHNSLQLSPKILLKYLFPCSGAYQFSFDCLSQHKFLFADILDMLPWHLTLCCLIWAWRSEFGFIWHNIWTLDTWDSIFLSVALWLYGESPVDFAIFLNLAQAYIYATACAYENILQYARIRVCSNGTNIENGKVEKQYIYNPAFKQTSIAKAGIIGTWSRPCWNQWELSHKLIWL